MFPQPHEALGALGALGDEVRPSVLPTALFRFRFKQCQEPGDAMVARATWSPALYPGHPHGVPRLERLGLVGAAGVEAQNEPHPDPGLAGEKFGHGVIVGK